MQKALKYSSLLFYMLKPYSLLTHGFEKNKTAQEEAFKHICNFWARAKWVEGIRVVSYYLDVETTKYQSLLLNPTPLDCIAGCVMVDAIGGRDFKRLTHTRPNCIDGSISNYCDILNSPERL